MESKRNCIIGQSGGPTVAINSSLAGVIDAALASGRYGHIYGMLHGIEGLLEYKFCDLKEEFADYGRLMRLRTTPAMYLGSCRFKLPERQEKAGCQVYQDIFRILAELGITDFFYIGGNDSMDTIAKLSVYAKEIGSDIHFIGIPKTIDNDLMVTDHTPGFGSAAKYIATAVLDVMYDSAIYRKRSITVVEIMGRNAGWLTAAAALAKTEKLSGVDLIYLPEVPFSREAFLQSAEDLFAMGKEQLVVAVSEGIKDRSGEYIHIGELHAQRDAFGHISRSGAGKALELMAAEHFGCKARSVEINVLQRSSMHCASATDLEEAFLIGRKAVEKAIQQESAIVLVYRRLPGKDYRITIESAPVEQVANLEKRAPREWINEEGNHVNGTMINYLRPLIQGEVRLAFRDGVPAYL